MPLGEVSAVAFGSDWGPPPAWLMSSAALPSALAGCRVGADNWKGGKTSALFELVDKDVNVAHRDGDHLVSIRVVQPTIRYAIFTLWHDAIYVPLNPINSRSGVVHNM